MSELNGERAAVRRLLRALTAGGWGLAGIFDGEVMERPKTEAEAMALVFNLDESSLRVRRPGGKVHGILIVLGNHPDGSEVVADWNYTDGDPDGFDAFMDGFAASEAAR